MRPVDALARLLKPSPDTVRLRAATIQSSALGLAVVSLAGQSVTDVPYLASYTPVVGNTVLMLQTGKGQFLILGTPA